MKLEAILLVLLGSEQEKFTHAAGVAPLVIVPRNELDEVRVELNSGRGIKDGGGGVADEIGRDDCLLSVCDDALVFVLGSMLYDSLNLIVGCTLLSANDEIDDGYVESGDTERKTGQLAVEGRDNLSNSLGSAS